MPPLPTLVTTVAFAAWAVAEGGVQLSGVRQPDAPDHDRAGLSLLMTALFGSTLYGLIDSAVLGWTSRDLPWVAWSGVLLVATGVLLRIVARATLRESFSGYVQTCPQHRLVTNGLYAWVRHPLYLATLVLFLGIPAAYASWGSAVISLALGVPALVYRIRVEEAALAQWFGDEYSEYRRRTAGLLPLLW